MKRVGRPSKVEITKHPLQGTFNGEVPWLDGCRKYKRDTCTDCPVPLGNCSAENPRLHKGGRPQKTK